MIDEVSLEQEAEKNAPHFEPIVSEPGFIRKFATDKKIISSSSSDSEAAPEQTSDVNSADSDEVVAQLIESKSA